MVISLSEVRVRERERKGLVQYNCCCQCYSRYFESRSQEQPNDQSTDRAGSPLTQATYNTCALKQRVGSLNNGIIITNTCTVVYLLPSLNSSIIVTTHVLWCIYCLNKYDHTHTPTKLYLSSPDQNYK